MENEILKVIHFFISVKNYRDIDNMKMLQIQQMNEYQAAIDESKLIIKVFQIIL